MSAQIIVQAQPAASTGWAKKMTQLVFVRTSSNLHQLW